MKLSPKMRWLTRTAVLWVVAFGVVKGLGYWRTGWWPGKRVEVVALTESGDLKGRSPEGLRVSLERTPGRLPGRVNLAFGGSRGDHSQGPVMAVRPAGNAWGEATMSVDDVQDGFVMLDERDVAYAGWQQEDASWRVCRFEGGKFDREPGLKETMAVLGKFLKATGGK